MRTFFVTRENFPDCSARDHRQFIAPCSHEEARELHERGHMSAGCELEKGEAVMSGGSGTHGEVSISVLSREEADRAKREATRGIRGAWE